MGQEYIDTKFYVHENFLSKYCICFIPGSASGRPNFANHANGLVMSDTTRSKVGLLPDDIIEKYKEAISHYAKVFISLNKYKYPTMPRFLFL